LTIEIRTRRQVRNFSGETGRETDLGGHFSLEKRSLRTEFQERAERRMMGRKTYQKGKGLQRTAPKEGKIITAEIDIQN